MNESIFGWVKERYQRASPLNRVFLSLVVMVLITLAVISIPMMRDFVGWIHHASPVAQAAVMLFLALVSVYGVFGTFERLHRADQIRHEQDSIIGQQRATHESQVAHLKELHEREIADLRSDLEELRSRAAELERQRQESESKAAEDLARAAAGAEQRLAQRDQQWQAKLDAAAASWQQKLLASDQKRQALEDQWNRVADQEANQIVWRRPDTTNGNSFLPLSQRKTIFIGMMNLKGGVGKTTLAANVAACWAQMPDPLRVLVVDTDFQGSLGNMCVEPAMLELQWKSKNTTSRLLAPEAEFDLIDQLAVPMHQVPGARVIFARDDLETTDFRVQSRFMLRAHEEVRFWFQKVFHQPQIREKFDIVLFDCPPRLTASSVNALACCDYLVVPTKLDNMSVSCMPRTLDWIHQLQAVVRAKLLAVVANETSFHGGQLVSDQSRSYGDLVGILAQRFRHPQTIICRHSVRHSVQVVNTRKGVVACAAAGARKFFMPLAQELRERLKR